MLMNARDKKQCYRLKIQNRAKCHIETPFFFDGFQPAALDIKVQFSYILYFSIYHLLVYLAICMVLQDIPLRCWLVIILIKFNILHTITQLSQSPKHRRAIVGIPLLIPTKPRIMLNYQKHLKTQPVKKTLLSEPYYIIKIMDCPGLVPSVWTSSKVQRHPALLLFISGILDQIWSNRQPQLCPIMCPKLQNFYLYRLQSARFEKSASTRTRTRTFSDGRTPKKLTSHRPKQYFRSSSPLS